MSFSKLSESIVTFEHMFIVNTIDFKRLSNVKICF